MTSQWVPKPSIKVEPAAAEAERMEFEWQQRDWLSALHHTQPLICLCGFGPEIKGRVIQLLREMRLF